MRYENATQSLRWHEGINRVHDSLFDTDKLNVRLNLICDAVVDIFDALFCRIWIISPGDRCDSGCLHAHAKDERHQCRYKHLCLHLEASCGYYSSCDGTHARVPYDCYKIGRIASGKEFTFLTNDVMNDIRVHDHEWAKELGLVSFAGYQLRDNKGNITGVLALFAKHEISAELHAIQEHVANIASQAIQVSQYTESLEKQVQSRTEELVQANIDLKNEIAERKQAEKEKQKATDQMLKMQKLESIGVLAGGIAHDFNNILAAILGNIELVGLRAGKEDQELASLLSNAQKATARAAKLTDQLLTFSKGGDPVKEIASLPELITESADFVLHGSNISCQYRFPKNLWLVDVDNGQISQVIQNIILNAKHAMQEGGTITIECSNVQNGSTKTILNMDRGDYVCITLEDRGCGIPEEIIHKIFDPYFTTNPEGSGLGMAICHSIISKHGGHISVQSQVIEGTIFTIYLPAIPLTSVTAAKQQETQPVTQAIRVMAMDDEETVRTMVQAQLTALGHEAIPVTDGEQAIEKYQQLWDNNTPVDLVIMDLTIPGGMGGKEAAKRLLQKDPHAKIIVASGYSNDPVMANYQEYGFCAAMPKPYNLDELQNTIKSALKRM